MSTQGALRGREVMRWVPALAWMGLIFVLSAQPGLRVSDDTSVDGPLRLVAHLAAFAVLGYLLCFALAGRPGLSVRRAALAVALATLYGVSDEIHQSLVPDRSAQLDDVLADAIGAALGVALAMAVARRA